MLRSFLRSLSAGLVLVWAAAASAQPAGPAPTPEVVSPAPPAIADAGAMVAPPASSTPARPDSTLQGEDDRPEWAREGESESLLVSLVKTLFVLGLVLALVYLTLNVGLRKLMRVGPKPVGLVKVLERVPLEPKKSLYVIEAAGQTLLVGAGEHELTPLGTLDAERVKEALARPSEQPAVAAKSRPFWERLIIKPPPKGPGGGA